VTSVIGLIAVAVLLGFGAGAAVVAIGRFRWVRQAR